MVSKQPVIAGEKVCPVVLRMHEGNSEILLFRHPLAGVQLVKGTVESSDCSLEHAAFRELLEESGLESGHGVYLGSSLSPEYPKSGPAVRWHFVLCAEQQHAWFWQPRANGWRHYTLDDGGHWFEFFWWPLEVVPDKNCHAIFHWALSEIRRLYSSN